MTDFKLIAIDLDGTSLKKNGHFSDATRNAIEKAIAAGIMVVPTTGRTLSEIPDEIRALPGMKYAIIANGASIMDLENDEEIYSDLIPLDVAAEIFKQSYAQNLTFYAYSEGISYCDERFMNDSISHFGAGGANYSWLAERVRFVTDLSAYFAKGKRTVEKIGIYKVTATEREILEKTVAAFPEIVITSSDYVNMEINSATANKGSALLQLCSGLGITPKEIMAIGDGNNDVEMLTVAGFSVAMGNAVPRAKQAASYITVTNEEEGLAAAFRKFLRV